MSYKLEKPYSENEKMDFIVEHNHNNGLQIEETDTALFALEVNEIMVENQPVLNLNFQIEQDELLKQKRIIEIQTQLEELDKKRVRAICEPSMKTDTQSWLEYYNEQVMSLRQVMAEL